VRRLDLVVGPNGAGKTTFVQRRLAPALPPIVRFVNADEIARRRWPDDAQPHGYDAARLAAQARAELIRSGESFIAETVFSHPSKLELVEQARAAGYLVLLHVLLVPEQLVVPRVRLRVRQGGHGVPEHKVLERYRRLWPLVAQAMTRSDQAWVYDNAGDEPVVVAELAGGVPVGRLAWPDWTPQPLPSIWRVGAGGPGVDRPARQQGRVS
jgi:predicted ABC-type ATPase